MHTVKDFSIVNKAEVDVFLELVAQLVNNPPTMQVLLGWEDPLEKG